MDNIVKHISGWLPHFKPADQLNVNGSVDHLLTPAGSSSRAPPHVPLSSRVMSAKRMLFKSISQATNNNNNNDNLHAPQVNVNHDHTTPVPEDTFPMVPSTQPMDAEAFRKWGKAMVDYVADYWTNMHKRKPLHSVEPGYIWERVADHAPYEPESWENIFADLENVVMKGTTHWHHPNFYAYYPAANSYPAIMGDILSGGIGCIGFTWNSSPACTELEMVVMDWLGKMLRLPEYFLNSHPGPGAGMIQSTASDSTLVALLAARNRRLFSMRAKWRCSFSESHDTAAISTLVAYCSDQAHSSVERAALLAGCRMRKLPSSSVDFSLTGDVFEAAVKEDLEQGLVPFFVCVTLGTTASCAFDRLLELGPICQQHGIWVHIDAAYAGSSFICPEYRVLLNGIEFADSFNFNCAKWLMVNMDCSAMWFKNAFEIEQAFLVDPLYLQHEHQGNVPDYKNLQVPLGRRFRSLKLWFVLRAIGVKGLQEHIRSMCALAKEFEGMVREDERFEVAVPVVLGLVCFRAKDSNEMNEELLKEINRDRRMHLVPAQLRERYILRFAICSSLTRSENVHFAWKVICEIYQKLCVKREQENGPLAEG